MKNVRNRICFLERRLSVKFFLDGGWRSLILGGGERIREKGRREREKWAWLVGLLRYYPTST